MKNVYTLLKKGGSIILSIIALIVSCRSYKLSEKTADYERSRDMLIYTPALKENIDSTDIEFTLNVENAELQGINITFPNNIRETPIVINTKPVKLSKISVEVLAEEVVRNFIMPKDLFVSVSTFSIPVMIDYSAIVYGFPQTLRENRYLIFDVYCDDYLKIDYSNSFLISKCGFPLKSYRFYTAPFASSLEDRIKARDREDVLMLLKEQLNESITTLISPLQN